MFQEEHAEEGRLNIKTSVVKFEICICIMCNGTVKYCVLVSASTEMQVLALWSLSVSVHLSLFLHLASLNG